MKRRIILAVVGLIAGLLVWMAVPAKAEAAPLHCQGIALYVPNPDVWRVDCYWGRGWFRPYVVCYRPIWVIENGEVVDYYEKFHTAQGRWRHKAAEWREDTETGRARCPATHPFIKLENDDGQPWMAGW